MMDVIVEMYGNQFTTDDMLDTETGMTPDSIVMEFALMDVSVGEKVDKRTEDFAEKFIKWQVMPELILSCGHKEYVCTTISVEMYRRYTEIMEWNDSDSIRDAFEANTKILMTDIRGKTAGGGRSRSGRCIVSCERNPFHDAGCDHEEISGS